MCEQQVVGGGFLCGCDSGYLLNADGRTCSGTLHAMFTLME